MLVQLELESFNIYRKGCYWIEPSYLLASSSKKNTKLRAHAAGFLATSEFFPGYEAMILDFPGIS